MKTLYFALCGFCLALPFTSELANASEAASSTDSASASALSHPSQRWSYEVNWHGTSSTSGLSIGAQTPSAWRRLNLRLAYNFDRLNQQADRLIGSTQFGIKFYLDSEPGNGLATYFLENINLYQSSEVIEGGRVGFEACYGVELREQTTELGSNRAVYLEAGLGTSNVRTNPNFGGQPIGDTFVSRLGVRRYF